MKTYDEIQMAAELVTCSRCRKPYYMTKPQPLCVLCRQAEAKAAR